MNVEPAARPHVTTKKHRKAIKSKPPILTSLEQALAAERAATHAVVDALVALVRPNDPEKFRSDLQTELRHTTTKRRLPHVDITRLESLQHTYMKLLRETRFAAVDPEARVRFAIETVTKTAKQFMRTRESQGDETRISLRCGGRHGMYGHADAWSQAANRVTGQSVDGVDGNGGGGHILSRPDWKLANAEEDKMIEMIDRKRAQAGKPEHEYEYEMWVRILGSKNADWLIDYQMVSETKQRSRSPRSDADRAKHYRLTRKLSSQLVS